MPPCVRGLVWLTKPVPLRGEPWSFYRLAHGVSHECLSASAGRKAEKEFLNSNYTIILSTKSYYFNTLAGTDRKIGDIKSQKFLTTMF